MTIQRLIQTSPRSICLCSCVCFIYVNPWCVCMFVPGSFAAGHRSCVGGLSFVCVLCGVLLSLFEGHKGLRMLYEDYTGRPAGS